MLRSQVAYLCFRKQLSSSCERL